MAREYARVKVTIWADPDFRTLTPAAQHLYFLLLTSANLNLAGVADWRPGRLAAMAAGWTVEDVKTAGEELENRRYVVIDKDTEEVLIRSFVRHDGVLKSPNIASAMAKDCAAIGSARILQTVRAEVQRAAREEPSAKGLPSVRALTLEPSQNQDGTVSEGFESISPIPQPTAHNQQPATGSPQPKQASLAPRSAARKRPSRPLPDDWVPNDKHDTYGRERHLDLNAESSAFRNHAQTHDRRCVDWDAAFRNWLAKAKPTAKSSGSLTTQERAAAHARGEWWR